MKAIRTPLLFILLIFAACSDDNGKNESICTAVINGQDWEAKGFFFHTQDSAGGTELRTIIAYAADGSKISFFIPRLGLSPEKLTAEFRSKTTTIASFTVEPNEHTVHILWQTTSETNLDRFEVERSLDGVNYTSIGTINSQGTPNVGYFYFFQTQDYILNTTYVYYRLKVVDDSGVAEYTDAIRAKLRFEVHYHDPDGTRRVGHNGKVLLTKFDKKNRVISGTFYFEAKTSYDQIPVSDGVLKNVRY
jgi:hypothetical protein